MTDDRLRQQHPRLAEWLEATSDDQRVERVRQLSENVADANGVRGECGVSTNLEALVTNLDEAAWTLQEGVDRGDATADAYELAFRRARAANSWLIAHSNPSLEGSRAAVYEAVHALGGSDTTALVFLTAN